MPEGSPTPWSYFLIRLLFKFILKIFYGSIVVENTEFIPKDGEPCIVCANHCNSLTDALVLVVAIPSKQRNMLRLTAKSTLFGKATFTSWLIESAGTVPLQRRRDFPGGNPDNSQVMTYLMDALELGDAVCLFPEGRSRYHSAMAPLRTGVARIVSDVLSRRRQDPEFAISVLNCSITYTHRQHWRSDVLVTFHPPMRFHPKDNPELLAPVDFAEIQRLTDRIRQQIRSGTFDAPNWDILRSAKLAARIYAPLGTRMGLGDFVRLVSAYVEVFIAAQDDSDRVDNIWYDRKTINNLRGDLKVYQDQLSHWGVKDDRIRRPLRRRIILARMIIRYNWSLFLICISIPGLLLWTPVFIVTAYSVHNFKKTGPIWDTWDEIAQYKLVYGFFSGLFVWFGATFVTLPIAPITFFVVPLCMWLTLRWLEDAISAFRAFTALVRLLRTGKPTLERLRRVREDLHKRVMALSVNSMKLPADPEKHFVSSGPKHKGRTSNAWEESTEYFSLRRRRKRDWNETLRLYDKVDFPDVGDVD